MSSQEQISADAPRSRNATPDCPQCNKPMTVKQVSPVLFAPGIDDVVYGCGACGTEAKRSVRRTSPI
jgi:hypothetical protein